jgi:hypothetical protein
VKLRHIGLMDLGYEGRFLFVRAGAGPAGAGFGYGDGGIRGPRLEGTVTWVSHPRRLADGAMLPAGDGVVTTHDGAAVVFTFEGKTVTLQKETGEKGGQLFAIEFSTSDERYAWLNRAVCVGEAVIDPGSLRLVVGIHELVNEMLERLP